MNRRGENHVVSGTCVVVENRWDENAGLRRDAIRSQVIDALEAQGDNGDRHEKTQDRSGTADEEFCE